MPQAATESDGRIAALMSGAAYRELAGLTEDEMEAIYGVAWRAYEQGEYDDAERTFRVLCLYDHLADRYWLGLGACRQARHDFEGAIQAYSALAEIGSRTPLAPLRAAECYIALGMVEEAASALDAALERADEGDAAAVLQRVRLLLTALRKLAGPRR
jgi:type III secretion system low calcium response chaperone LcrH/SycD